MSAGNSARGAPIDASARRLLDELGLDDFVYRSFAPEREAARAREEWSLLAAVGRATHDPAPEVDAEEIDVELAIDEVDDDAPPAPHVEPAVEWPALVTFGEARLPRGLLHTRPRSPR